MTIPTKDTGGAAFPSAATTFVVGADGTPIPFGHTGMTLRDWFAGQALAGIIANRGRVKIDPKAEAGAAYIAADAMLKARGGE